MTKSKMTLKRFDSPDSTRTFPNGHFYGLTLGEMTVGMAIYEPGWVWSRDIGKALGQSRCQTEHHGMVSPVPRPPNSTTARHRNA